MKRILFLLMFLTGCGVRWTADDQRYMAEHCRGANSSHPSCDMSWTKTSSTKPCEGTWTSIDCQNKEDPNKDGFPKPKPSDSEKGDTCIDCPGDLGGSAIKPGEGSGSDGNGKGGGALEGAGDVLKHWGNEIGKGWDGVKNEINGNNAEKRRRKREAKRLMSEMRDLWKQAESYGLEIEDDKRAIENSWGLLNESWQDFGLATREQDLSNFRSRYNTRTHQILDGVPVADPSVFEGLGKGRGEGIYPEHAKVEAGRKYLAYARGKLDPNAADYEVRKTLVDLGDAALDEAESSYRAGNVLEGNAWYEIAMAAADAALSLTPGVGWAKDVYEASTGKSLLTGKKLSDFERTMAAVGALTGGIAKLGVIAKAGKIFGIMATTAKTAEEAEKIAQAGKEAVEIAENAAKAPGLLSSGADSVKAYAEAASKYGKSSGEVAESLKSGKGLFGKGPQLERSALNEAQASNLKRFEKKLPSGAEPATLHSVNNGVAFKGEVPGRVPGSKAVYEKVVDAEGNSLSYTKTTYRPDGNIVHIKDKIDDSIIMFGE